MYKLGLYDSSVGLKFRRTAKIESGENLNDLIDIARAAIIDNTYYMGIILDENNDLVFRITTNFCEYKYLTTEQCDALSNLLYQICQKLNLYKNAWYKISNADGYNQEVILTEKQVNGDTKEVILRNQFVRTLIETFIINIREATGMGVNSIIFNAREVKESVKMYICYREYTENTVRVECRKRH